MKLRQTMRIILAAPRGFCAGVNMAVESLQTTLDLHGPPVHVYHEIVHNRWVVEDFRSLGVVFVDRIEDVPEGSRLLYSAHGVSPAIRHAAGQRRLDTIDATCPLVTKVHREAVRFASEGYTIVLVGHAGHDEVVGTMGEAPEAMTLVDSVEQVDRLDIPPETKLAYLTQTTLTVTDAAVIIDRLRERFPHIVGPPQADICYATQNRQEAVRRLASEADVVLVVGSQNSSNSRRLAEIARSIARSAHRIDGPDDIQPAWFDASDTVLLTAGASAPEHLVQQCVEKLQRQFDAEVHQRVIRQEDVRFLLPSPLREALEGPKDEPSP